MGKMNYVYALIFVYFVGILFKSSLCQTNDGAGSTSDVNVTQSNSSVLDTSDTNVTQSNSSVSDNLSSESITNTSIIYTTSDNSTLNITDNDFSTDITNMSVITMDTNLTLTSSISFNDTDSNNVTIVEDETAINISSISNITTSNVYDVYNETQNATSFTTSSFSSSSSSSQPKRPTDSSDSAGTAASSSGSSSTISGLDNFDSGVLQPLGGSLDGGDTGFVDASDGGFVDIGGADGGFGDLTFGPGDGGFGDGISEYDICAQPPCDFPTTPAPAQDITLPTAPPPPPPPPPPANLFDSLIPNIIPAPRPPPRQAVISPNTNVMAEDLKNKIERLRAQFFAFQANNHHSGSSSGLNFFDPLSLLSRNSDSQSGKTQSSFKPSVESNIRNNVITDFQPFPNTIGNTINIQTNTIDKNMVPGVPNLAASTNIKTASVGINPGVPNRGASTNFKTASVGSNPGVSNLAASTNIKTASAGSNLATSTNIKTASVGTNQDIPPPPPPPQLDSTLKRNKPWNNSFKTTQSFTRTSSAIQLPKTNRISDFSNSPWPYRPGRRTSNSRSVHSQSVRIATGSQLNNVNSASQITNPQSLTRPNIDQGTNTGSVSKTSSTSTLLSNTVKNENPQSVPVSNSANWVNSPVVPPSPAKTNVNPNTLPSSFSKAQSSWLDTTFQPGMPLFNNANLPPSTGNAASGLNSQMTFAHTGRRPMSELDRLLLGSAPREVTITQIVTNTKTSPLSGNIDSKSIAPSVNQNFLNKGSTLFQGTKPGIVINNKGTNLNTLPKANTQDSASSASDNLRFTNTASTFDRTRTQNNVPTAINVRSNLDQLLNPGTPAHRSNQNFAQSRDFRVNVNDVSNPQTLATNSGANTATSSLSGTSSQSTGANPPFVNSQLSVRNAGIPMWSGNSFDTTVIGNMNSLLSGTSSVDTPTGSQTTHTQNSNTRLVNTGTGSSLVWTPETRRTSTLSGDQFSGTPRQFHPTIILPQKQPQAGIPSTPRSFNPPQPSPLEAPPTDSQTEFADLPPPPPPGIEMDANTMMNRIMSGRNGLGDPVITTKRSPRLNSNIPSNAALTDSKNQAFLINTKSVDIQNSGTITLENPSNVGLGTNTRIDIGTSSNTNIATDFRGNTDTGISNKGTVENTTAQSDALSGISLMTTTDTPTVKPKLTGATRGATGGDTRGATWGSTRDATRGSTRNGTFALRRELPNAPYICRNCNFVNGFCYVEMPGNCNRFIECSRQGMNIRAFEKECSFGLFWNQANITCQIAYDAKCASDPCKNLTVQNHPYIGKCRAFWTCRKGASSARCCAKGYGYGGTAGKKECVPMDTCNDECVATLTEHEIKVRDKCLLKEDPFSPFHFIEGTQSLPCAPGTRFSPQDCTCIQSKTKSAPLPSVCSKDLFLNFEGGMNEAIRDRSGKGSIIEFSNVFIESGIAKFNQNGRIKLWKYANLKLGPSLAITFKFLPYRGFSRMQTLLSNCNDENEMAAIDISLDTWFSNVIFKIETTGSQNNHLNEIKIKYTPFHWNDVVLIYSEGSLAAAVGINEQFKFIEGQIPNRHPAIILGGCGKASRNGFIGYMDSVSIYNGCVPDDLENTYLFG